MNMFELTFDILLSPFSDDNFGMACVIVHRIFIFFFFFTFPYSVIHERNFKNILKKDMAKYLYRLFILIHMILLMYWIFIPLRYFNMIY